MKIYLASRFSNQAMLREVRDRVRAAGHFVTSRWIDRVLTDEEATLRDHMNLELLAEGCRIWATEDLIDLDAADAIMIIDPTGRRGGVYVEMGYALAKKKAILFVGPRTNAFTYLDAVNWYDNLDEFLKGPLLGARFWITGSSL